MVQQRSECLCVLKYYFRSPQTCERGNIPEHRTGVRSRRGKRTPAAKRASTDTEIVGFPGVLGGCRRRGEAHHYREGRERCPPSGVPSSRLTQAVPHGMSEDRGRVRPGPLVSKFTQKRGIAMPFGDFHRAEPVNSTLWQDGSRCGAIGSGRHRESRLRWERSLPGGNPLLESGHKKSYRCFVFIREGGRETRIKCGNNGSYYY